ncbi:putative inner membrane domain protein, partial [Chlamydia psittaci 06-1683]
MHQPISHLSPNNHILHFFGSITREKSAVYEISLHRHGPLEHLINGGSSQDQDINNLLIINNITAFTQTLFTQQRPVPAADLIADCSICFPRS